MSNASVVWMVVIATVITILIAVAIVVGFLSKRAGKYLMLRDVALLAYGNTPRSNERCMWLKSSSGNFLGKTPRCEEDFTDEESPPTPWEDFPGLPHATNSAVAFSEIRQSLQKQASSSLGMARSGSSSLGERGSSSLGKRGSSPMGKDWAVGPPPPSMWAMADQIGAVEWTASVDPHQTSTRPELTLPTLDTDPSNRNPSPKPHVWPAAPLTGVLIA